MSILRPFSAEHELCPTLIRFEITVGGVVNPNSLPCYTGSGPQLNIFFSIKLW